MGLLPTADRAAIESELRLRQLDADADLVPVTVSWQQLADGARDLSRAVATKIERGSEGVAQDTPNNRLVIEVAEGSSKLSADAKQRADDFSAASGLPVSVLNVPASRFSGQPAACSFPDCDRPLRGGVLVYKPGVRSCSDGALAVRGADLFIITAGHCVYDGGTWNARQASGVAHGIGSAGGWFVDGTRGDAGAINVSPTSWWVIAGWTPETAAWNVNLDHQTWGTGAGFVGEFTCHFGIATGNPLTGVACGTTQAENTYEVYFGAPFNTSVGPLDRGGACTLLGDSGGPVIDNHTIVGFISATSVSACGSGNYQWWEKAPNAASWLGGLRIATIF